MLTLRIRSTRSIWAGPLPMLRLATADSGTDPTLAGTRNWAMASRSVRKARSRRTRMGICRWGRLSLGRLTLKSPEVATRTAPARADVVTPRSAARAKSGRIWISGRWRLAPEVTLPTPLQGTQVPLDGLGRGGQGDGVIAGQRYLHLLAGLGRAHGDPHAGQGLQALTKFSFHLGLSPVTVMAMDQPEGQGSQAHVLGPTHRHGTLTGGTANSGEDAQDLLHGSDQVTGPFRRHLGVIQGAARRQF
jgi:hypothetical protein